MKILIISCYFPPFNIIGAVRVGKMAKYLSMFGHDIKVITADKHDLKKELPLEMAKSNILSTNSINVHFFIKKITEKYRKIGIYERKSEHSVKLKENSKFLMKLLLLYKNIFYLPDKHIGWFPFAFFRSSRLIKTWKPDLIYASAMPFTSLLIGYALHKRHKIPWIAELRDLWVDNPYYNYSSIRKKIECKVERLILSSTKGLITVSEPLAHILREKYCLPVEIVLNGFDQDDYPAIDRKKYQNRGLKIAYTGSIYQGRRDPSLFFKALQLMGEQAKKIKVSFYGPDFDMLPIMVEQYNIQGTVEINSPVSYQRSLFIQQEADILLLLLWDDPQEKGVYTGKLFEYLGARRPILAIGYPSSAAAELIINRQAGVALNDPEKIARQLKQWLIQIQETGSIPDLPPTINEGLSRKEQARRLENFMMKITKI